MKRIMDMKYLLAGFLAGLLLMGLGGGIAFAEISGLEWEETESRLKTVTKEVTLPQGDAPVGIVNGWGSWPSLQQDETLPDGVIALDAQCDPERFRMDVGEAGLTTMWDAKSGQAMEMEVLTVWLEGQDASEWEWFKECLAGLKQGKLRSMDSGRGSGQVTVRANSNTIPRLKLQVEHYEVDHQEMAPQPTTEVSEMHQEHDVASMQYETRNSEPLELVDIQFQGLRSYSLDSYEMLGEARSFQIWAEGCAAGGPVYVTAYVDGRQMLKIPIDPNGCIDQVVTLEGDQVEFYLEGEYTDGEISLLMLQW